MAPNESPVRAIDLADIHVLVVEDYEDTLEVFGAALQQFGANVLKARNARHALTIMKTVRVNVIVSDLTMPGEDGLWLLQQIRRLKSEHGRSSTIRTRRATEDSSSGSSSALPVSWPCSTSRLSSAQRFCLMSQVKPASGFLPTSGSPIASDPAIRAPGTDLPGWTR